MICDASATNILGHTSNKVVKKSINPSRIIQLPRLTKLSVKLSNWNKGIPMETKIEINCNEDELNKAIANMD